MELSSHQLEFTKVSPNIAILLNVFEEHLDHYKSYEHYINAKLNICRYQKENDYFLYSIDNECLKNHIEKVSSAYSRDEDSKRTSFIIFTTGTTSKPKAVQLSQFGILNHIYHNLYRLNEVASDKFMCLLPMFHCFGLLVVNTYLSFYRIVYINEMKSAVGIYKEFMHSKCGDSASIGYIYDRIARAPGFWMHRKVFY